MLSLTVAAVIAPTSWTMVLGGDIMLNSISLKSAPLAQVVNLFEPAAFAYANLEIPLTSAAQRTARKSAKELKARSQFILRADPAHISSLQACGIDVVSLGNNHAMDYGIAGLRQMRSHLSGVSILTCGAGESKADANAAARYVTADGVRISVISFLAFQTAHGRWKCTPATDSSAGIAEIDYKTARIRELVRRARVNTDLVAVALHWGIERQAVPNSYQVKLGRAFIDAGSDLVVGNHPHVLQGAEMYRNKPILYSLGNLVSPKPSATGVVRLTYQGKSLKKMEFLPCSISGGAVRPVARGVDFQRLCLLVAKRFPSKLSRSPRIR